jgi:hypothetical protein
MKTGRPNLESGAARQRNNKTARLVARVPGRLDGRAVERSIPQYSHISMWLSSSISRSPQCGRLEYGSALWGCDATVGSGQA